MPALTIGLPVYNGARYLDGALASLSAQTGPDIEILVSDNASTDETPEIIRRWAARDPRIRVHRQPENIGALPNFLWTLHHAAAPLFMFAAHDDFWSPNYARALKSALDARPGAKLSVGRLVTFIQEGHEDIVRPALGQALPDGRAEQVTGLLERAQSAWFYGLFDRAALISALRETAGYRHTWACDFTILLPFLLSGAVTGSEEATYYKRVTPLSDERYRPKTAKDQIILTFDFWREGLRALKAAPLSLKEKAQVLPAVLRYARHGGKFRRSFKLLLKGKAV